MLLNGTSSRAETTGLGAITASGPPARTIAAIVNRTSSTGFRNVVSLNTSANGTQLDMSFNGTTMICEGATSTANGPTVSTGKMYLAVDKASGSTTPRFHKQIYGTDTAVAHSAGSGAVTENATIAKVSIGSFSNNTDWFAGDIYVVGIWNRQLADSEHEWLAASVHAWYALAPDWLIVELGAALPTNIPDLSGNGAPLTTLTSLAVSTVSMPVGLGGVILPVTHPAAAGGGTSETPTPGTATADGVNPTATVTITPTVGQATGTGITPTATISLTPTIGTTTAAGVSPTSTTNATPTVGTCSAAGVTPTPRTSLTPTVGTSTAAGVNPTASVAATPTVGTNSSTGITPGVTVTITPGVGTATGSGISPSDGTAGDTTPTPGVATGTGISPTARTTITSTVGQATAAGIAPTPRIAATPTVGAANATSTSPTFTVTVTVTPGTATGVGISPVTPGTADPNPVRITLSEAAHIQHRERAAQIIHQEHHHLTT